MTTVSKQQLEAKFAEYCAEVGFEKASDYYSAGLYLSITPSGCQVYHRESYGSEQRELLLGTSGIELTYQHFDFAIHSVREARKKND